MAEIARYASAIGWESVASVVCVHDTLAEFNCHPDQAVDEAMTAAITEHVREDEAGHIHMAMTADDTMVSFMQLGTLVAHIKYVLTHWPDEAQRSAAIEMYNKWNWRPLVKRRYQVERTAVADNGRRLLRKLAVLEEMQQIPAPALPSKIETGDTTSQ
jgi:hypothetical protein